MTTQNIEIDTAFLHKLPWLEDDIEKALKRTINRVTRWLRSEMVKHLATELNLKISASKYRFKAYSKGTTSKLWIGLNDLNLHYFGEPSQDENGVNAAGKHYKIAFINSMRSSESLVWRRTSKRRLPIEPVRRDISKKTKKALKQYTPKINAKFEAIFNEEINHVITGLL